MMDGDRDPALQSLFADARQDLPGDEFIDQVLAQTDKQKNKVLIGRVCVGMVVALLVIPLQDTIILLTQIPLITLEEGLIAQLLEPLNSIGALLSAGLIGLRILYRKVFS